MSFERAARIADAVLLEGPLPAAEVLKLARRQGITPALLRKAREHLAVRSISEGCGRARRVVWALEENPGSALLESLEAGRDQRDRGAEVRDQRVRGTEGQRDSERRASGDTAASGFQPDCPDELEFDEPVLDEPEDAVTGLAARYASVLGARPPPAP